MFVFKDVRHADALTGLPMVMKIVAAAQGRRRGCVTTVDHL
jgi:hypothetical protein